MRGNEGLALLGEPAARRLGGEGNRHPQSAHEYAEMNEGVA
jgi:hypothetical protein